jgi:protein kinase A
LTEKRAKTYVCEASLALDELHRHEIIYRDLKVSNVMLDKTGHLKLGDFGIAKRAICADSFVGSTCYLPPELIAPGLKKIHDKSVDWYLLGVFLY